MALSPLAVVLAMFGALSIAAGVGLVFIPAGVITLGIESVLAAYVVAYLKARR